MFGANVKDKDVFTDIFNRYSINSENKVMTFQSFSRIFLPNDEGLSEEIITRFPKRRVDFDKPKIEMFSNTTKRKILDVLN